MQGREPRVLPGGLVMYTEMPGRLLNSPFEKQLYASILLSGFNYRSPIFKDKHRFVLNEAATLIEALKEQPKSLKSYATLHRIINCIELMEQNLSAEESTCICTVTPVFEMENRQYYEVEVNRKFFELSEVHAGGFILFTEAREGDQIVKSKALKGRLIAIDSESFILTFYLLDMDVIKTDGTRYEVSFEPSDFTARARHQVLPFLTSGRCGGADFMIFTDNQFKNNENEMSLEQYMENEQEAISKIQFSSDKFNPHQKLAIHTILSNKYTKHFRLLPFILHGPPGTGKTTTIVETVRLLIEADPLNHILICTPSNTAADLVALELLKTAKIPAKDIFRAYALTKQVESQTNKELDEVSCIVTEEGFNRKIYGIWDIDKLEKFKVIVCTLSMSAYLFNGGMSGRFTHIFIDEAGQATEIDTMIPIIGLRVPRTNLVLAGDFKQLGPVVKIYFFERWKHLNSLIERLAAKPFYKKIPCLMMMLVENYRSHHDIIKVSSELYYEGKLIVSPNAEPRDTLVNWKSLPAKGVPLIWHHVSSGEKMQSMIDENVRGGHSFCNYGEVTEVLNYVQKIVDDLRVLPKDIGIISPYKLQVLEISTALKNRSKDFIDITVDTVERFQGSERRVIIVSPVRSTKQLGFVSSPKRFNTTITRAKELLIVVGNHQVMGKSGDWKKFIHYCVEKGAVINVVLEQEEEQNEAVENGNVAEAPSFGAQDSEVSETSTVTDTADDEESTISSKEEADSNDTVTEEDEEITSGDEEESTISSKDDSTVTEEGEEVTSGDEEDEDDPTSRRRKVEDPSSDSEHSTVTGEEEEGGSTLPNSSLNKEHDDGKEQIVTEAVSEHSTVTDEEEDDGTEHTVTEVEDEEEDFVPSSDEE